MADYLTRYDETEKLELEGFWVELRTCLTGSQMRKIRAKQITRGVENFKDPESGDDRIRSVITGIDADVYAYELAIASITDWSFETDGKKWPLSPDTSKRAHYDLLTEADQDAIEAKCVELNAEPTKKEAARFPVEDEGGLPAGQDEASDDGEVRPGAEALDTPGPTPRPSPA